jgi:hypothetical protein
VVLAANLHGQESQNMIGRQTQNEGFSAVPAPSTGSLLREDATAGTAGQAGKVTIDGKLDDWDLSGQIWSFADTSVRDSFSVKTAAMWDADHLYLSFLWRDPMPLNSIINPEFDPERGWVADAVQLRILADKQPSWITVWGFDKGRKPAVHFYYWAGENQQSNGKKVLHYTGKAGEVALGDGIESAYAPLPDGKGFIHEMKVPWKLIYNQPHSMVVGQSIRMGMEFLWGSGTGRDFPMHRYADNMQPGTTSREFYWSAKNAWGNLTAVAEGLKEPRKYVEGTLKPQGTIAVRAQVPATAAAFTLAIDDLQGNRVRNLAGGFGVADMSVANDGKQATVEVMWDGLDEQGKLVLPGTYKVHGLTHGGLNGYYEMSFYNPGTPPWQTDDTRGAWGADHAVPRLLARSGENIIITSDFAEGGYGTFAVKPDGTKAWSEKRGASVVAATAQHVYTVPNDWGVAGVQLLRLQAKDGKFAPFLREGKELPMPLPFGALLGVAAPAAGAEVTPPPKARALGVAEGTMALATDDNRFWLFDAESAALIKQTTLELTGFAGKYPFAFDGRQIWFFRGADLMKLAVADLKTEADPGAKAVVVPLRGKGVEAKAYQPGAAVEKPGAIAVDDAGNVYVTDLGKDLQVKKFSAGGEWVGSFGKRGGRARQGAFEPDGLRAMAGVAVDAAGNLWVAEASHFPRRVSVWTPEGAFKRDFIGNTGYAGQGSFIHDSDPTKGVAELNEIKLNPATHSWEVASVMCNPDPEKGDYVLPGSTAFGSGNVFFSEASGKRHEYFVSLATERNTPVYVMMKNGGDWQPVAAIFTLDRLQGPQAGNTNAAQVAKYPSGEYADNDRNDMLIWNDFNNDGYVQKAECEIIPALAKKNKPAKGKPAKGGIALPVSGFGGGGRVDPGDFSFYADGTFKAAENKGVFKYTPVSYRDGGKPVFSSTGITPLTSEFDLMEAVPVPGKDVVVAFIGWQSKVYVAGFTKKEGKILWKYISPYHQVHGSHRAPMPKPGMLIGCLKIAGIVKDCGEADGVMMIRGNLGEDYFLTTDGMFVDIMTKDGRIPGIARPQAEAELRAISFSALNGRGEHFSGAISRQADGVVRASGAVPADQACNIIRVEGLESIRRFGAPEVSVTQETLIKADQDNSRRALVAARSPEPYTIGLVTKDAKGQVQWNAAKPLRISQQGQPVTAEFRALYDADSLYLSYTVSDPTPWKNTGNEYRLLFKTGDGVDFQLSPSGNRTGKAVAGDFRVVMANFNGKPVAVLMKPVMPGAPEEEKYTFSSPVMSVTFDQVKLLSDVVPTVAVRGSGYILTAKVPWSVLGVAPKAELKLRGDVGFILSDPSGTINTARVYWSNRNTNLVNDQPSESLVHPQAFGDFILGKE